MYSLVEASRESGYSADHLGRLVREGKTPNAGRPGARRVALKDLPRKAHVAAEPRLAEKPRRRELSNAQIVQSIIEKGNRMLLPIPTKSSTHSERSRPAVPGQVVYRFRAKSSGLNGDA